MKETIALIDDEYRTLSGSNTKTSLPLAKSSEAKLYPIVPHPNIKTYIFFLLIILLNLAQCQILNL